jgi:UPF0271 protein
VKQWEVDINCDVGEGVGNEALLFPHISSCNLACGAHAGDEQTIREVAVLAISQNVKIGAHPSYPDRENFGRHSLEMKPDEFRKSIRSQIRLLREITEAQGGELDHIKAHGALYNDLARDRELSRQYLRVIEEYRDRVSLYVPYGSVIGQEAEDSGFRCIYEAFGDRNYEDDLSLVSRKSDNALITSPEDVLEHLLRMIIKSEVKTVHGNLRPMLAHTYCIHGDTANAYEILAYLSVELPKHNIHLNK